MGKTPSFNRDGWCWGRWWAGMGEDGDECRRGRLGMHVRNWVSEWVRVGLFNRRIRAIVTMRRGVNWTKTTSAADEILRCRCRASESWLADCSRAVVQRLWGSGHRAVCWSAERSTCRCRLIGAGMRDKLAVVYKICRSCIVQSLVDQEGQLEIDSYWCTAVCGSVSQCSTTRHMSAFGETHWTGIWYRPQHWHVQGDSCRTTWWNEVKRNQHSMCSRHFNNAYSP